MRVTLTAVLILFLFSFSFAQTPGVKWSRLIGGTSMDYGNDIVKTTDDGFLFAGTTQSNNKDISGYHGATDLLLIKLNKLGIIEWQKCLGGTSSEGFRRLLYNSDGSAIVIGITNSNDGDVAGNHGNSDLWVVKIDASGNIVWEKTLGGSLTEEFRYADITNDNGYIITGYTTSNDGDVIGNHGGEDIWIVKLDASGNLQWQQTLGGSASDRPRFIMQNSDGTYLMVGSSASLDGNITGSHGNNDVWVVKLNSTGNVLWQKVYGGTSSDTGFKGVVSNNGSITILANTQSIDGDVSGRSSTSDIDTWAFNVDYNTGNINWQRTIGGGATETPVNIFKDVDDELLITSITNSTDGDAISNHGSQDVLLTRLTSTGNLDWTKCFGGPQEETVRDIYNDTTSKSYVFVASTRAGGGDVIGYHQNAYAGDTSYDGWVVKVKYDASIEWQRCLGGTTYDNLYSVKKVSNNSFVLAGDSYSNDGDVLQQNRGNQDAWVVQVGPINTIKGTVFLDYNSSGTKDVNEPFYSNARITSSKTPDSISTFPFNGSFENAVDTGNYITTLVVTPPYYNVVPSSFSSSFSTYFKTDSISFALQAIPNKQDLSINIIPITADRPGFSSTYRLFYKNVGTTTISSGEILFKKDSRTTLVSSSPTITTSSGDTLKWNYSNFAPGDTASIFLILQLATPPTVNVGDTLSYLAMITPVAADETPSNDTATLKQRVVGSFDPNDKTENNGGVISSSFITNGDYLQYTVRFQNTGTADAINVVVRDTLGNRVDLNTLEVVAASHPYSLSIENGSQLVWTFNNIMLPPSSVDEPSSHGYISYRIRPKSDVVVGETIHNTASIYFDYNLPVLTNDATTLVQDNFSTLPIQLVSFTGQLNDNTVQLNWQTGNETNFERFDVERSIDGFTFTRIDNVFYSGNVHNYKAVDNVSSIQSNRIFYRLKLVDRDGKFIYSNVVAFAIVSQNRLMVYPNPARTQIFVSMKTDRKLNLDVKIIDASGKLVGEQQRSLDKGNNVFAISTSGLKNGSYILQIVNGEKIETRKFTIVD